MPDTALRRNEAILGAVRFAAERLLGDDGSWETDIDDVLAALGRAAEVSRVYVYRASVGDDGRTRASQVHEWVAPGASAPPTVSGDIELDVDFDAAGWSTWVDVLRRGDVLHACHCDLPDVEPPGPDDEGVSVALVPIMVGPTWWGFIGFDECVSARDWRHEIDALRAAATTLAGAIHRQRARDQLQGVLQTAEARVAALAAIADLLTVDQPLEATLEGIAGRAVAASTAIGGAVQLVDQTTGDLRLVAAHGLPEGYAEGIQASWRMGVDAPSTRALRSQQLTVIHEARQIGLTTPEFAPIHELVRDVEWDTIVVVPLDAAGRNLGAVNLYYRGDEEPAEDEITFLRAVADQAAVAVENARLLLDAQSKAGLEERQRLARELHDSVSQALYGIALGAKTARTLADTDPGSLTEPLDYVLGLAEAALSEMRALIFELRPESLEQEGLVAALDKQVASVRGRHGLVVEASLGSEPDLPLATKEALYRIAQEALHNVVKHAGASRVELTLAADGRGVVLTVCDDGTGFDPDGSFPGHLGLSSMRERADLTGGTLTITSRPGAGTCVAARVS